MTPHDQQRFSQVTLVGLIIAIFGSAFMFGGRPVIAAMLLLLGWVLVVLDEDMRSGRAARANRLRMIPRR